MVSLTRSLFDKLGHKYTVKRVNKNGSVKWRCTVRGNYSVQGGRKTKKRKPCNAVVIQRGDTFTPGRTRHICKKQKDVHIKAKIVAEAKLKAMENKFASARKIVEPIFLKEYEENPDAELPVLEHTCRAVNRYKNKNRPKNPKNLLFNIQEFLQNEKEIPKEFLQDDIRVNRPDGSFQRHLVFATTRQLKFMRKIKRWYMDATFHVVPSPFYQLFSVHGFIRRKKAIKQVPLAFVLMSKKSGKDYRAVFASLSSLAKQSSSSPNAPLKLTEIVVDFERAVWTAAQTVFPNVKIMGCAFHWSQCLFKRLKKLGLAPLYVENRETRFAIRQLMSLNLLPADKIRPAFYNIAEQVQTVEMGKFCDYIETNWITSKIWPPITWSVFCQTTRTNNDVEGWHNRLNHGMPANVNLERLIEILAKEARYVPLHAKLVSQGQILRQQRKKTKHIQFDLQVHWDAYNNKNISEFILLEKCAEVYQKHNAKYYKRFTDMH